jgi:hypothetical protein|nr:MAG TPA: hypothetical protein [Caudoviricetes sp.]
MRIELLNDMYLEAKKGGGYELFKRYTSKSGEPRRKRIAYAGDLEQAVKSFLQAVQYEELKDLHTVFDGYVKRVEECNRETVMKIVEKVEQELKSE